MKPLIQKIPLAENRSFVAQTFRTPNFEVGWHQHIEHELILFTEGGGLSFIGNDVGEFETGDIYLLGADLPHTFQKRSPDLVTSAVVVHFREDCLGRDFFHLPETRGISDLLATARFGLKITSETKTLLQPLIKDLEIATGFQRILLLGQCLEHIATSRQFITVSSQEAKAIDHKTRQTIDRIFNYTTDNFREPITLKEIAALACMSVPAFCAYFKRTTKKTYIDFLNELRVGYACSLLIDTPKSVLDICYESGYNTMANFHKQFLRLKRLTPLQYRKLYTSRLPLPQNNIHIVGD